jgi:hypothetical protein
MHTSNLNSLHIKILLHFVEDMIFIVCILSVLTHYLDFNIWYCKETYTLIMPGFSHVVINGVYCLLLEDVNTSIL